MNALIALAVWCQPHGPVTILTTQHRRPPSPPSSSSAPSIPSLKTSPTPNTISNGNSHSISSSNGSSNSSTTHPAAKTQLESLSKPSAHQGYTPAEDASSTYHLNNDAIAASTQNSSLHNTLPGPSASSTGNPSLEQKKSRRSLQQPSPNGGQSPVGSRSGSTHPSVSSSNSSSPCECQFSLPSGEKSLHSVDPANSKLSYISQPAPVDSSLFAPIRIACIPSLNAETYCGREGSVFFGDGVNGYVLSYMFTVYDAQSRGHRVKYTIMTMMTDRVYLVASMDYLISQFQVIASNLQSMAESFCPQQPSPAPRSLSYSSSHSRGSIMPENAPTKRGRPLTDVLAKPDIFVQLHAAFVSVLSNCSQRLIERHIQGRPINECTSPDITEERPLNGESGEHSETIDSLRELRRVLGRQPFNRLIWNSLVGNQVIVRGEESRITREIIRSLEGILPKECRNVILDGPAYEPSYACNILGLDRSVAIPPNMDPQDFILLDVCMNTFGHQIPTPPTSLPASNHQKNGSGASPNNTYQADWSNTTFVADLKDLPSNLEKAVLSEQNQGVEQQRAPTSSPGLLYSPGGGFQAQRRRYLLQAGEEPPEALESTFLEENRKDTIDRKTMLVHSQQSPLYIETVNDILDLKMPKSIESKRLAVLREEWIGKSRQFHNLKKAGYASNQSVVDQFLQSMRVDKRDLKILRFFTRCARSSSLQSQKYLQDDLIANASFAINRNVSD
ncbi:unnamed protein product [Mortierella alpina]